MRRRRSWRFTSRRTAVVGLILCSRVRDDVGHVTQVCLLSEYRGQGIGEGLMARTCNALRNRKFKLLTLTVTEANHRAVDLYRKLGFETRRVFDAFVWEAVSSSSVVGSQFRNNSSLRNRELVAEVYWQLLFSV